jgi:hypothetical protein
MELHEAQLFRVLTSLFGEGKVFFDLSAALVCRSGKVQKSSEDSPVAESLDSLDPVHASKLPEAHHPPVQWERLSNCLFTIIDHNDIPQLVVEFSASPQEYVDVEAMERQKELLAALSHYGVRYVVLTKKDLYDILDPTSALSGASFLLRKIEEQEDDEDE